MTRQHDTLQSGNGIVFNKLMKKYNKTNLTTYASRKVEPDSRRTYTTRYPTMIGRDKKPRQDHDIKMKATKKMSTTIFYSGY